MKLIVLDRDGVINHDSDDFIKSADEWLPIDGSLDAISRLNHSGYTVVIAANQSGLARGYFDIEAFTAIHKKLDDMLAKIGGRIDAVFYCPHGPDDACDCRKPKPGMLLAIGQRFNVPLKDVIFIGDSVSDINAAKNAHAKAVLVRTGKGVKAEKILQSASKSSVPVYDNLASAVTALLQ
ncbi:MAG: D-glycero-beta-D-manno-heptose 1,7-bisphosphate 7-phosphatase [Gammaproteobacteria bacterium]|jgi:D-glycero-D-manno-heptose 1,7-bisphosphate phosphatase|nr:D-glycero-beta-D-manno-heptose 1,7-bisphosphate 7-phosphatase [Gammaproteobacteria bacterium]